jgi:hypothetical protein
VTVDGKGISVTWRECHAIGLALLGESAWEIAVGSETGGRWDDKAALRPFKNWKPATHDDATFICSAIDVEGASALTAWWLAMDGETLDWYRSL